MVAAKAKAPIDASRLDKELGGEFLNHKDDETKYGGGSDLPAGINGGVAQLVEAKIDEYKEGDNKGKLYLMLAGVVKKPTEFQGVKIEGLRTQVMKKLFANNQDTKDQAVAKALNEVRKMGGETAGLTKFSSIMAVLTALKEQAPHFRFRTYEYKPEDSDTAMIIHEHRGVVEYDETASNGDAVIDKTGSPADGGASQGQDEDWDTVLAAANSDDGDAQEKLQSTCKAMGMSDKEVEDAPDWEALATYIKTQGNSSGQAAETTGSSAGGWKPEEGEEYTLKLKGFKSAKKLKVMKVFKETVHLYDEVAQKDYKGLSWADNPPRIDDKEI